MVSPAGKENKVNSQLFANSLVGSIIGGGEESDRAFHLVNKYLCAPIPNITVTAKNKIKSHPNGPHILLEGNKQHINKKINI